MIQQQEQKQKQPEQELQDEQEQQQIRDNMMKVVAAQEEKDKHKGTKVQLHPSIRCIGTSKKSSRNTASFGVRMIVDQIGDGQHK